MKGLGFSYSNTLTHQTLTCSKPTLEPPTPEQCQRCSGVFIINFERTSHVVVMFSILT